MEKAIVLFDNGEEIAFAHAVKKVINLGGVVVVMLDVPQGTIFKENVFGIDQDGRILWQVPKEKYVYGDSPYTDIKLEGGASCFTTGTASDSRSSPLPARL